jgi:ATP-dependent RNA helicase DDX6/DHH1
MTDALVEKLKASTLQDKASSDDWKKDLKLPRKDNRQQTEVGKLLSNNVTA